MSKRVLTNANGAGVKFERLARIKLDGRLAFIENSRPVHRRFAVRVGTQQTQRNIPKCLILIFLDVPARQEPVLAEVDSALGLGNGHNGEPDLNSK